MQKKNLIYIALGTVGLLLIPLLAGWPWELNDFVIMGILLFGTGLLIDLAWRKFGKYRVLGIVAVILVFLWLWAELAVGIFT
jgi:hypothetical protein